MKSEIKKMRATVPSREAIDLDRTLTELRRRKQMRMDVDLAKATERKRLEERPKKSAQAEEFLEHKVDEATSLLTHPLYTAKDMRLAVQGANEESQRTLSDLHELGPSRKLAAVPSDYLARCSALRDEFPHFESVIKKKIIPELAISRYGGRGLKLPTLCLQGAPGVGKTYFANRIAATFDLPFKRFNLEGAQGNFVVTGLDRSYSNHRSGGIFKFLSGHSTAPSIEPVLNGIIVFEELDKAAGDTRFGVENALIQILEETTAQEFTDLSIPELRLDIRPINFMFTANDLSGISPPVLSRMTAVELPQLTPVQGAKIAKSQFVKLISDLNLMDLELKLCEKSLEILSHVSPRMQKSMLRTSIGNSIIAERREVLLETVEKPERNKAFGFI